MVQQLIFKGGAKPAVRHVGRLVRTPELLAEQKAGKFLDSAYGTRIDADEPTQGPHTFNVANTNAIEPAGRVLAMWEGGSAFALSTDDLSTLGPVTFGANVAAGKAFTYAPKEPLRILVMRKNDITQRRVFELPSQMVFHVGNAHERADGSIALSFVSSPTPEFVMHAASAPLAGRVQRCDYGPGTVVEEHIMVAKPGGRGELDA